MIRCQNYSDQVDSDCLECKYITNRKQKETDHQYNQSKACFDEHRVKEESKGEGLFVGHPIVIVVAVNRAQCHGHVTMQYGKHERNGKEKSPDISEQDIHTD